MIARRIGCLAASFAIAVATAAFAEFERWHDEMADIAVEVEGDSGGSNHYILECGARCPGDALTVAIGRPAAVIADTFGNVYFSGLNIVYRLDTLGNVKRVAGDGTGGYFGDGGPAQDALLNIPFDRYPEIAADPIDFYPLVGGLATDASGNLYIADAYNDRIRKVDTAGIISSVMGGSQIKWPQGVAVDATGNLFVTSAWGTLSKITPDRATLDLAHNNCGPSFRGPGFCVPEQIALDTFGAIYVPDGLCRVRKVSPDGSIVTIAGNELPSEYFTFTCGNSGDGGPAVGAALSNMPYAVAVDSAGNLYIADTYNHCIRKVDSSGIITTVAGVCEQSGYAGDGGPATGARLNTPYGVAVDVAGNVYVADTENRRIRMVSADGVISTIAGNGND